jgi:hypothetical protein
MKHTEPVTIWLAANERALLIEIAAKLGSQLMSYLPERWRQVARPMLGAIVTYLSEQWATA